MSTCTICFHGEILRKISIQSGGKAVEDAVTGITEITKITEITTEITTKGWGGGDVGVGRCE